MKSELVKLTFSVEIDEGEKLAIPDSIGRDIGKGKWLITIEPNTTAPVRSHKSFLNGYSSEDEGLYDDC